MNTISQLNQVSFYESLRVEIQNRVWDEDITLTLMDGQGDNKDVISNPSGRARFKITLAENAILPTKPKLSAK